MAADRVQDVNMKPKNESSSESIVNPETGLITDEYAMAWVDTQDMQRLGKKQEFKACPPMASLHFTPPTDVKLAELQFAINPRIHFYLYGYMGVRFLSRAKAGQC